MEGESFGAGGLGLELCDYQRMRTSEVALELHEPSLACLERKAFWQGFEPLLDGVLTQVYFDNEKAGMCKQPSMERRD